MYIHWTYFTTEYLQTSVLNTLFSTRNTPVPVSLPCSRRVSFESLYGTKALFLLSSPRALITLPKDRRPRLMLMPEDGTVIQCCMGHWRWIDTGGVCARDRYSQACFTLAAARFSSSPERLRHTENPVYFHIKTSQTSIHVSNRYTRAQTWQESRTLTDASVFFSFLHCTFALPCCLSYTFFSVAETLSVWTEMTLRTE